MSSVELRRRIMLTVDSLSAKKLKLAEDLLRRLQEEDAATAELLAIPGFTESYQRGMKDIAAGRVTPLGPLKRKE